MAKLPDQSVFGENVSFWVGKIVNADKNPTQRTLMSGGSWGFRYRVRLVSDYSNNDTVSDDEVFVAQSLLPLTAGTGAAGRSESLKISQGDMVLGIFLGPDRTAPFIVNAFPRTDLVPKGGEGKYAIDSGFNSKIKSGLQELQEFAQTALPAIPKLIAKLNKGNGKGKGTPVGQLGKVAGGLDEENTVGALPKPPTLTKEERIKQLRDRTARRNASEGNRVGDIVDISEERAFEASLDAEVERSRAGDRSGLDDALQLY